MALRWGINANLVNRANTISSTSIESIVTGLLIPMLDRYNDMSGLDWRGRFTENSDERMHEFEHLDQTTLSQLGAHSTPRYLGVNKGTYQEFTDRFGEAVGYDREFIKYNNKPADFARKMQIAINRDIRRIRFEVIKEMVNPTLLGRGFWNQTFDSNSAITTPPKFGVNTFLASHTHYNVTGAATLADLDVFSDAKQHIREHGVTNGDYVCIMNSADITQIEKLAPWIGTNKANIANSFTDNQFAAGLGDGEFSYMGINFITEDFMPSGYFALMGATGSQKPFKFHEPNNSLFQGLLWEPGHNQNYPWMDSYVFREFRVRTYHRWQGVVYKIGTGSYTVPSDYT